MSITINENLHLELLNESHAQELFNLTDNNREYLRKWLPWVDGTKSVNDTLEFIRTSQKQNENKKGFQLIIKYKKELAGILGLVNINNISKHTEIGYWLGRAFTGKGIMTEACRALTDYCFKELNLNRVVIKCEKTNSASQGIPLRLNFKEEGLLRQEGFLNGRFVDHIVFAMLKEEWE